MIAIREGDLLASNCEVICHQTNCMGAMGAGIASAIRDAYPEAYTAFKARYKSYRSYSLGEIDLVPTIRDGFLRCVVNCYGQKDYLPRGVVHTNYAALQRCFDKIKNAFAGKNYTIGFPYGIGCGLAGGDWGVVSRMIEETFAGDEWRIELWRQKNEKA